MQTRRPCRGRELQLVGCQARHAREGIVARFGWAGACLLEKLIHRPLPCKTMALQLLRKGRSLAGLTRALV